MHATLMRLAVWTPDWNSLDSVRRTHSDLEAAALVFFFLLVVVEAFAHRTKEEHKKNVLDLLGIAFFAIAVLAEIVAYPYGQRNDTLSEQTIGSLDSLAHDADATANGAKITANGAKGTADAANLEAGKAQASAHEVESKLSAANAEIAQLGKSVSVVKKRQQDRHIENDAVSKYLKGKPSGTLTIWYQPGDREAYQFALEIMSEVIVGGWHVPQPPTPIPDNISSVTFLGPEYREFAGSSFEQFDRTRPPIERIAGGSGELTLLSKVYPDEKDPNSTATILTNALKPLVFSGWGWKRAAELPDNTFLLIVGPKP